MCNRAVLVVALPLVLLFVTLAERLRPQGGRAAAHRGTQLLARVCGVSFIVGGASPARDGGPCVVVANHCSPLDIPALLVAWPDAQFLATSELFDNWLLAPAMRAIGTKPIDRQDARKARRQLAELAREGRNLRVAIFAEGRIAVPGEELEFKTGAFALAIAAGASIVPVAIHGTADVLPRGGRLLVRSGQVMVEFLPTISTVGLVASDRKQLRDHAQAAVAAALASHATPLVAQPA